MASSFRSISQIPLPGGRRETQAVAASPPTSRSPAAAEPILLGSLGFGGGPPGLRRRPGSALGPRPAMAVESLEHGPPSGPPLQVRPPRQVALSELRKGPREGRLARHTPRLLPHNRRSVARSSRASSAPCSPGPPHTPFSAAPALEIRLVGRYLQYKPSPETPAGPLKSCRVPPGAGPAASLFWCPPVPSDLHPSRLRILADCPPEHHFNKKARFLCSIVISEKRRRGWRRSSTQTLRTSHPYRAAKQRPRVAPGVNPGSYRSRTNPAANAANRKHPSENAPPPQKNAAPRHNPSPPFDFFPIQTI